ncbi:NACHT domain-containing protein, partial [Bradyrhizobium guangdongense]|uniref:NACHT domain-containing protein n=1 Tax=Bradyrhizobium guangdongense TaxID=1325090 RepID=UPI00164318A4
MDIDQIFVPLVLERAGSLQTFGHSEAIRLGNRIRITGDPGSGKSSVAKRIFRDECTKALKAPDEARLPLLVELRRLDFPKLAGTKKLGEWLYNRLLDVVKSYDIYQPERCFSAYTVSSGLLVILDGLDEVSAAAYPQAEAAILGLGSKLEQMGANNILLLTMRTQFHLQVWRSYADAFPVSVSLKRFSPTDIYAFLTRWPFDPTTKTEHVVRIYNDLTDRPALREMCTNPLILSMYVAQDQASDHQLTPESRSEFYKQVTEELLIRRRAKQIGPSETQMILRRQRERILGRIAFEHLCDGDQPANLIPWESGTKVVIDVMGLRDIATAERLLRDVSKETGLISEEREGETFRFIHLTFCEFLAAMEATQGRTDGWDTLIEKHTQFSTDLQTRTRLAEVIPFAASLLPAHAQLSAIKTVSTFTNLRMLALAFLETKRYEHPIWQPFVDQYWQDLIARSEGEWTSQWLAEVHLFLVVVADANRSAGLVSGVERSDAITTFFQHFAGEREEYLAQLIASYAQQDAPSAFRVATLCGIDILSKLPAIVVDNIDQPAFLDITIERAARDKDNPIQWATLFAEAGLRSPAAAALLVNTPRRPWINSAQALSRNHKWAAPNFIPESCYSDCLSIAHASETSETYLRLVGYFRKFQPPGTSKLILLHARLAPYFYVFVFSLYVALAIVCSIALSYYRSLGHAESEFVTASLYYIIAGVVLILVGSEFLLFATFISLQKRCRTFGEIA